ncbi:ATP-dependent RNA helicase HrpA [Stieleria sp. TO1_6]|uniref:ATP-dependent RNA helicase HrpA n=1 Tax=Stieleria tagensis TaxID=2956795 RepID=UPI00209BB723|nr:ATP-dependent RNA helicase HrpA [Stieleria tagensis]MCO8125318.1 ATP-dependent RNA helicase HrpA [Stieleria tagensis]
MNFKPSSPRLDSAKPAAPGSTGPGSTGPPKPDRATSPADVPDEAQYESQRAVSDSSVPNSSAPQRLAGPVDVIADDDLGIENAMQIDQHRLRRQQQRLPPEEFQKRLSESITRRRRRQAYTPHLDYPAELPITAYKDEIIDLIRSRQVIVVCGETGSGKSTQLPKFCLEAGLGRSAVIGHTQPRRLAARSIATRLCEEMQCNLGEQVGYQVRFGDQTGPDTMIKLMTDGILLAETGSDRMLDQYDVIIIDEAHERSLNIDFLLAYLRGLQSKRPDLRIIITSATIDADKFAEHFSDQHGPAPILNVEGRGYPVETRYLPWEDVVADDQRGYDLSHHVIAGIKNLSRSGNGDTLIFLPTERDIRLVSHRVAGHYKRMGLEGRVEILPLYARLPQKDQQRIFHPSGQRQRLIFATNVAESSLTVPGIRCVIDSGTARISRYSPRSKLQRLPIEPVSRASADQRAGRCGRVGPGICIRLFSESDFDSRDAFTTPEIRRTNLASVVLQSKMLGFGSLDSLPLLDVPRPESIREGVQTLVELGAIDDRQELTDIGRSLGRMPVDPRIGRIILAADEHGVLPEILPIAAAMEIPDPRQRPQDQQQAADQAHAEFRDGESDFLSLLRLWRFYEQARSDFSRNRLTRELRKRFLSPTRMREWADTYRQLRETATGLKSGGRNSNAKPTVKVGSIRFAEDQSKQTLDKDRYAAVHQALLTGFLSGVAMAGEKNVYLGPRNLKLFLWPGSGVFDAKPKWIVAAELVETGKQYARTVARIQPQWVEQVGQHLLKSSYSEPHWSQKSGGAFCYQRQSLFGLPIVVKRRVPLPPIDPGTARELLVQHGLVEQQLVTNARFVRHNRALRESFAQLAAKTRRRDLVIDDFVIAQFYLQRLPDQVCDKGRLDKFANGHQPPEGIRQIGDAASLAEWLHDPPQVSEDLESCFMRPSDLIETTSEVFSADAFPDQLAIGNSRLPLEYRYEPGAPDDGIRLRVHQAAVTQISDERLGWLVPGLLHNKIVAMIKSLPKRIRRNLVPAADVAAKIYDELMPEYGQVPFMPAVCKAMSRHAEMPVGQHDFQADKMDDHYQFLVQVVDDDGKTLASARSAESLVKQFSGAAQQSSAQATAVVETEFSAEPMQGFELEQLPAEVVRERGGVRVAQYPALVDAGDSVQVQLFPDQATADAAMMQGLTRLYSIAERKELRRQVRWLPDLDQTKLYLAGVVPANRFESALIDLLARIAFVEKQPLVRSKAEFEARRNDRMERISVATQEIAGWLKSLGQAQLKSRGQVESMSATNFPAAAADVRNQIKWLLSEGFLAVTPWDYLQHYPRFLSGISYRLEKLQGGGGAKDQVSQQAVSQLWNAWLQRFPESEQSPQHRAADEFRWMIEELRISLFAQPLGTSIKVSVARCEKWLAQSAR